MTASEHSTWAESAASALSAAGYRRGGARAAMLELLDRQRCALSAVEIEEALRKSGERIARAELACELCRLRCLRTQSMMDHIHDVNRAV